LPEVPEVGISPVIKYRLLVGGVGIAYEGESESEGRRQFGRYELEKEKGGSVTHEVGVDAKSGKLLENSVEGPRAD
jgi:hypothetical protein